MSDNNPFEEPLKRLEEAVKEASPVILRKMGTHAVNFAHENFEKEGFQGASFEPWAPRKKETRKTKGKKILTNTAQLRNNTHFNIEGDSVVIRNNVPYAKIHNEGGTIDHPERSQVMNFKRGRGGKLKLGKIQTLSQRNKIVAQAKATVGAHSTSMVKRQFIGYSPVLNKRIEPMIIQEVLLKYKR